MNIYIRIYYWKTSSTHSSGDCLQLDFSDTQNMMTSHIFMYSVIIFIDYIYIRSENF